MREVLQVEGKRQMKADDPIIINHVNTTPFITVEKVLFYIVSMLRDEAQDEAKKEHLAMLRDMLNQI